MSNTHRSPTPPSTKRLLHELQLYSAEPNDALLHLGPVGDEQILHWEAVLKGVKRSGYEGASSTSHAGFLREKKSAPFRRDCMGYMGLIRVLCTCGELGGLWKLDIRIPDNYPLAPPEIRFVTPICHPNVNFKVRSPCHSPRDALLFV